MPLLLLFLFTLPLIQPILTAGFFRTDDGGFMITRLFAFHETLKTGQFPVRFLETINHGYGYPVLDFLYPLPFYIGELIHLAGFSFMDSIKLLFALSFLLSAFAMYRLVASKWGVKAGLVSAVLYTYAPYRVFDVYKRGSLGEALAFIFLPLIIYYLFRVREKHRGVDIALGAFFYAALITSHNVLAFIFTPLIVLFVLQPLTKKDRDVSGFVLEVVSLALGVGLTTFFWLPAFYDLQYTRAASVQIAEFKNYFLYPDNLNYLLGPALPFAVLAALLIAVKNHNRSLFILIALTILSLVPALPLFTPVWRYGFLPRLVQFPWRFLSVTVFLGSVLAGAVIKRWGKWPAVLLVMGIIIINGLQSYKIDKIFYPETYYTGKDDTTTVKNEYLSRWVKNEFLTLPPGKLTILSGMGTIVSDRQVIADTPLKLRINRIYFPGWQVLVDGAPVNIRYENEGFLDISIPVGEHEINARFRETPVRQLADLVSLLSLGGLLFFLLKAYNKKLAKDEQ